MIKSNVNDSGNHDDNDDIAVITTATTTTSKSLGSSPNTRSNDSITSSMSLQKKKNSTTSIAVAKTGTNQRATYLPSIKHQVTNDLYENNPKYQEYGNSNTVFEKSTSVGTGFGTPPSTKKESRSTRTVYNYYDRYRFSR